ncbi:NAD(P)-binding protein [Auricularia subglabra TFB-10046 SS5]|nr:NAD(P)-binding protein [Auricularia subglabra TFB-10046 SS5]
MTLPATYKQWYWPGEVNGWQNLEQRQVPLAEPGYGEVLLKIHAVSLNYRDLVVARKQLIEGDPGLVPGCDPAGEIVAVGPGVLGWRSGDRVLAGYYLDDVGGPLTPAKLESGMGAQRQGTLQEYRILPAGVLVRIPKHLSYEEAATLTCAGLSAYNALLGGPIKLRAGQTVVLQGTGGVSLFAAQIAILSGARVILTSSSDAKLKTAVALGVHDTVNYRDQPEWDVRVLELTGGRGAEHVLDVGGGSTLARSLNALALSGQVTVVGFLGGLDAPRDLHMSVLLKDASLRGIRVGTLDMMRDFMQLVETHRLKPVVGHIFGFSEVKEAFECLEKQEFVGKIVVKVSSIESM